MHDFSTLIEKIRGAEYILIYTHSFMDGDALGSSQALCLAFRKLGKNAWVMLSKPCPEYLEFLSCGCFTFEAPFEPDLSAAVDIGDDSRLEALLDEFYKAPERICIDHHVRTSDFCGNDHVVDPKAAAAGCLVYELLVQMGVEIDSEIATQLYAAICTDTGSFRQTNTDEESMIVCAKLMSLGARYVEVCSEIYSSYPLSQLKLEAHVLSRSVSVAEGAGIISWCTEEDYESLGSNESQAETCIDRLRSVKGVEIAAMIKARHGEYKLSLRSKKGADVRLIAQKFGGGGHKMASGATVNMPLESAVEMLKAEIEAAITAYKIEIGEYRT